MQSGRDTLGSIDHAFHQVQGQIQRVDDEVQATSNALIQTQKQQTERYKQLAKIRLDHIVSGELAEGLDAATRRVGELLEERVQAFNELQRQVGEAHERAGGLAREREEISAEVTQAAEALDKAEALVQRRLEQEPGYQAQLETTRYAERVAAHAEAKTDQAHKDRVEKGKPYEDDPLFVYLWKRSYGTSRYSANPLIRFLDKWVARLCDFGRVRPNYSMLLEIPERLREHAGKLRSVADHEFDALKVLEERAAENDGIPALREALEEAEGRLDQADDEIQQIEAHQRELLEQQTGFAAGEDQYLRQAEQTLAGAFERENLSALYRLAADTSTAEDDILVDEMAAARQHVDQLKQALVEHKRMHEQHLLRLRELEGIRHQFKRQRYDSAYSGFNNAALIGMILSQFLQGIATRDDLWRTIQREQRHRRIESNPSFGSGGFPRRRGTWRTPFPGGGSLGGGWSGGRGGGLGGGFRTGGGF